MKRWGGCGWVRGAAVLAILSVGGGCGDDEKTTADGDAATETTADVGAETMSDGAAEVEPDTAQPETDTSVATETTADSAEDSAPDTTEPVDTAPDTVADTTEPIDTAPDVVPDTTVPVDTAPETVADTAPPLDTAEVGPELVTWDDVYPIFASSCTPCHAGNSPTAGSGGHAIASPDKAVAYDASQLAADHCPGKKIGECALERIKDGSMPASGECQDPVKPKCPDQDEQTLIQQWIAGGMLE